MTTTSPRDALAARLNWLRAGVLGANDGIISIAGLVVGVAAAAATIQEIATAGIAGLAAGAVSMALGEYVSVSAQRDTERALIEDRRLRLETSPKEGRDWMVAFLRGRGVSEKTSRLVIDEFSPEQLLRAHLEHGLGIDEGQVANPWIAAGSSCLSFSLGASLPLLAMLLAPAGYRIPVTFFAVLAGLVLTGWLSANLGQAGKRAAVIRLVAGGALAMAATYGIGQLLGTTIS